MSGQKKKNVILIAMLIGIPWACYQLYVINFGPRTDDAAIVQPASRLDEFAAMRAGMEKKEGVGRDAIEDLAGEAAPAPSPQPIATGRPEPAAPEKSECDQNSRLFDGAECNSTPEARVETIDPKVQTETSAESERSRPRSGPKEAEHETRGYSLPQTEATAAPLSDDAKRLLAWRGLTSPKPSVLQGMSKTYPGPVIRAGCRVLAQIEDELRVTRGDDHLLTLVVKGPMPGCKLPSVLGIRLVALAKLNAAESRICARVTQCSDESSERKSSSCSARVKSITGYDCLEGEVYDVSGWGTVLDAALVIGTAPTIGHLTQSAAQAKTIWTAEASATTAETLQKATARIGDKLQKAFDGREIRLARGAFVVVTFEADSAI